MTHPDAQPLVKHMVVTNLPKQQKKSDQKQNHVKILSYSCVVRTQDTLFDAVEFQQRYRRKPFALGDAYLTPFYQRVQ